MTDDNLDTVTKRIDNAKAYLANLSGELWNNPELGFDEHHAHSLLTNFLAQEGFQVEKGFIIPTAFRATCSSNHTGPNVIVVCEYDALPDIGHACGHNLIAEVGVAAGIAIKSAMEVNQIPGKVTILGTPAEEGGGGKIDLIRGGAFKGVDIALMAHPWKFAAARPLSLARAKVTIRYHGNAAHAAAFPWKGINALDAAVLCYQSISCMRQQMKPAWRIHGIITKGGTRPNVIPELTEMEFYIRAPSDPELKVLKDKAELCFRSAAAATGCEVEIIEDDKPYSGLLPNKTLSSLYEKHGSNLGIKFEPDTTEPFGSTDMGNVSHIVPSIHPFFNVGEDVPAHTTLFCKAAGKPAAQVYALQAAKALALTAIDVMKQPKLLEKAKADLQENLDSEKVETV